MPIYEVDVRKRSWDFYLIEANSQREAEELLRKALSTGNMDGITFDRTVTHDPVVEYAIQISPEGDYYIFDNGRTLSKSNFRGNKEEN
tara:strand:- start:345 stop:608 length:264 start_codon:yes stop_codon:yes gene_type:complete